MIFKGSKHEHPGEHLLNFHECMLEHDFVHEDVLIKMFRFSLEGHAHELCQSLPAASIHSLKGFHVAFHLFCKEKFAPDLLYPECCHDFDLLCEGSDNHEKSLSVEEDIVVEDIIHDKQDVEHLPAIISDYYGSEDIFALDSNHENHLSLSQKELEKSEDSQ